MQSLGAEVAMQVCEAIPARFEHRQINLRIPARPLRTKKTRLSRIESDTQMKVKRMMTAACEATLR